MSAVWKPGQWVKSASGKPAIAWWRYGVAATGEPSTVTQVRVYATEEERYEAAFGADVSWVLNPRPFVIDEDGFKVNGVFSSEIAIDEGLSQEQLADATSATNDRFEKLVLASQELFGEMSREGYAQLIERFVEVIVKNACRLDLAH
ncbi:hypothetical protein [Ottowia sp.]|uniref:hypothetical protein n=1 Tax=Ottowia sp. TaxID=1898956 RepID=UPI0025DB2BA9|nr:hypothetical protein [Ottowia sp.]MBK6616543.1 hypothetical protein [Ottowia sp.]